MYLSISLNNFYLIFTWFAYCLQVIVCLYENWSEKNLLWNETYANGKIFVQLFCVSKHLLFSMRIKRISIEFQFVGYSKQYDGISMVFVVYCRSDCRKVVNWNERRECICLCRNISPRISLFNQTEATCTDESLAQYHYQTSTS